MDEMRPGMALNEDHYLFQDEDLTVLNRGGICSAAGGFAHPGGGRPSRISRATAFGLPAFTAPAFTKVNFRHADTKKARCYCTRPC